MANSADQATQLAELFAGLSKSVDQFREDNAANLSDAELDSLVSAANRLEAASDQKTAEAIAATLDRVQDNVNKIVAATKDAKEAVQKIKKVQNVIAIASAAATLAGAIMSGNVGTIGSSSASLVQAIATATGGNDGGGTGSGSPG